MKLGHMIMAGLTVGLACLVGCGSDNGTPQGRVIVLNDIDSGVSLPVDVKVANTQAATNLDVGSFQGNHNADAGSVTTSVKKTSDQSALLTNQTINLTASIDQLLAVIGDVGGAGANALHVVNFGRVDLSTSGIPTSTQTRVYFANTVVGTGVNGISLSMNQNGAITSPIAWKNLNYAQMTNEQVVGDGSTIFTVNVNGTLVNSASVNLEGQKTYVVVVRGFPVVQGQGSGIAVDVIKLN
jgi:hypothetical protein